MAFKRKSNRCYSKKNMKFSRRISRPKNRKQSNCRNNEIGGVPRFQFVTLKYAATEELVQSAGGTSATRVYRGNSIYDPDYSGITQDTVAMYAFWNLLYSKYAVVDSTIRVTFQANSDVPMYCYIYPYYAAGSMPISVGDWDDLPGVQKINLQGLEAGNSTSQTITCHMKAKVQLGEAFNSSDACSDFGTNPVRQWFYWIAIHSQNNSIDPGCLIRVEIFYRTKLYQRKPYTGY